MPRQKMLIRHQQCIGNILKLPATTGCTPQPFYRHQLEACRTHCTQRPSDIICIMKSWVTEQNLCILEDITGKCGVDAANFYTELQVTVFQPMFPVVCDLPPNYELNLPTTSTMAPTTSITTALTNGTRPVLRFSKLAAAEKTMEQSALPNIVWNGMPMVTPKKNELVPLRERFPSHKLAFATLLNNVFPANVTERFISYNYSTNLLPKPIAESSIVQRDNQLLVPARDFSTEPAIIPRYNMPVTRLFPTSTVVPITPSFRVFAAKPPFPGHLSLRRYSSPTGANIVDTSRRWKPWYLGGGTPLNDESKRKLPLYHGLK
uniref:Apple domain-containing protein n=1 Tax=Steinernema glaseri TaxID=37863 RepID=A0A1I7Z3K6_9BILA